MTVHGMHLTVGPARFRLVSDWAQPIADLRRLYRDYPQYYSADATDADRSSEPANFTVRAEAAKPWRRYLRPSVAISGDYWLPDAVPLPLAHGLLALEMGMNLQMALGWRRHLLLHASSVERGGRALIMTGLSGSGKSTLSALLGERGWRFMGDEFALVDPRSGLLSPFPRLVSLKNSAIAAMAAQVPEARLGPLLLGTPKGDIRHLVPRPEHITAMDRAAPPALLLFPTYGSQRAVRYLGKAEVFARLTQASTNYVALGESGFAALTRLVSEVPARAIDFPDGDSAVELVETLWEQLA